MDEDQQRQSETTKAADVGDGEAMKKPAMVKAQQEAAEEREAEGGYQ